MAVIWDVIWTLLIFLEGTLHLYGSAVAFEEGEGGGEEASCSEGEEEDGVAVGSLGCGWGGGGVVEALGAALGVGWRRA